VSDGLRLALPGGALFEDACRLLSEAGVADIDASRFDRQLKIATPTATVVKVRPTDVPVYVEMGACDAGIVGKDVLWESPRDCYELVDLRFGACRLVLAVELIKLHGSVELAPAMGLADCVVDITATGRTLIANHLVEVAEAGRATARLISNQASLKTRSEAVNQLAAALRRTVTAGAAPASVP
jgi:ATP phosphoribosyltransferase